MRDARRASARARPNAASSARHEGASPPVSAVLSSEAPPIARRSPSSGASNASNVSAPRRASATRRSDPRSNRALASRRLILPLLVFGAVRGSTSATFRRAIRIPRSAATPARTSFTSASRRALLERRRRGSSDGVPTASDANVTSNASSRTSATTPTASQRSERKQSDPAASSSPVASSPSERSALRANAATPPGRTRSRPPARTTARSISSGATLRPPARTTRSTRRPTT